MKLKKLDVVEALKTITVPGAAENLIDSKAVTNIMVFGDQIDIDVLLSNPSLQARKKLEVTILEVLHQKVHSKAKIKINTKVGAPKSFNYGQPLPGIVIGFYSGSGFLWKRRGRKIYSNSQYRGYPC